MIDSLATANTVMTNTNVMMSSQPKSWPELTYVFPKHPEGNSESPIVTAGLRRAACRSQDQFLLESAFFRLLRPEAAKRE